MIDLNKIFSVAIKELRVKKGLSQEELAEKALLGRAFISFLERNKRGMTVENLNRIIPNLVEDPKDFFRIAFDQSSVIQDSAIPSKETEIEIDINKTPRILIVEDDAIIAESLRKTLIRLNYEPLGPAMTAIAAVELTHQYAPDLILMDIHLKSGSDGIEAARAIQKTLPTPIIFITAYSDDKTLRRIQDCNALSYILKPYSENQVKVTLASAVNYLKTRRDPIGFDNDFDLEKIIGFIFQKINHIIKDLLIISYVQDQLNLRLKQARFYLQCLEYLADTRFILPQTEFFLDYHCQKIKEIFVNTHPQFKEKINIQINNYIIQQKELLIARFIMLLFMNHLESASHPRARIFKEDSSSLVLEFSKTEESKWYCSTEYIQKLSQELNFKIETGGDFVRYRLKTPS